MELSDYKKGDRVTIDTGSGTIEGIVSYVLHWDTDIADHTKTRVTVDHSGTRDRFHERVDGGRFSSKGWAIIGRLP